MLNWRSLKLIKQKKSLAFIQNQKNIKIDNQNKIIMDLRVSSQVDRLNEQLPDSKSAEIQLAAYQKNMKIFISAVQKQMAGIIDKYQLQIKELKNQIARLKNQLGKKEVSPNGFGTGGTGFGLQSHMSECFSPIKVKGFGIETTRSNFLEGIPMKNFFDSQGHNFFNPSQIKQSPSNTYKFEINKTPDKLSKSRFEMQSKKKKQRQQDLLHFLQMGKSNLQLNTDKMFNLIGRSKQKKDIQNEQANEIQSPLKKKKGSDSHNTSLNSICDSLNNSFHGRKAQQKSSKKRKQQQSKQKDEARREQQRQKFKKQQGIKNLLTTMRKNISSSLDKPEIIKGSKLLSTGQKGKSPQLAAKSKVMINPVVIDLNQMNKQKQYNSVTTSPSKNPQSILKNSSTNFLTKSIENISAISFYSAGGD